MPAHHQFVRLLTRRGGIHRTWGDNPLLEIAEVFRIDVVGQAFGFTDLVTRVTYVITQQEEPALEQRFPFELPELENIRDPPLRRFSTFVHQAVFEDSTGARAALATAWSGDRHPNLRRLLLDQVQQTDVGQWEFVTPEEFFTVRHLEELARSVLDLDEDYVGGLLMVLNDIMVSYPAWFFGTLPMLTSLQNLTDFWLWLEGGRQGRLRLLSEGSGAHTPVTPP